MLTGDKMETAINIGFACKVLDNNLQTFRIEQQSKQEIMNFLTSTLRDLHIYDNKKEADGLPDMRFATVIEGEAFFKI